MNRKRITISTLIFSLLAMLGLLAACGPDTSSATPTPIPSPTAPAASLTVAPPTTAPPTTAPTDTLPAPTTAPTETAPPPPTETAPAPPATPTANPAAGGGETQLPYIDDRSTAETLLTSYVNAIERREYVRAYSYWEAGAAGLAPFDQFQQGYADTMAVKLTLGPVSGDAGAGQRYYSVAAVLQAQTTNGATQTFAGCYQMHLAAPEIQAAPPFRPLALSKAMVQLMPNDADLAGLLARACPAGGEPVTQPTPDLESSDAGQYLDNRTDPVTILHSFYNAINRKEYARAYSYWEAGAAGPAPFDQFQQGYTNTVAVQLTTGTVSSDPGAGQLNYSLPVVLKAQMADGTTQTFAGCYQLHLSQPGVQGAPPFQPLGIRGASLRQVPNDSDPATLLGQGCP